MVEKTPGSSKGLLESLTALSATLIALAHTRLDLLSVDMEEAFEHASALGMLAVISLFCCGVGVVLVSMLIVVAFWDTHRLLTLGVMAAFFLAVAAAAMWVALRKARARPRLFAASLAELFKDRQQLVSRS